MLRTTRRPEKNITRFIDPLNPYTQSQGDRVLVVSGRVLTGPTVDVHESVSIEMEMKE